LALAAGEGAAAFGDGGGVAFGELVDEVVGVGFLSGGDDFLVGGLRFAEADVISDASREEDGDLRDDGDVLAKRFF